MRHIFLPAVLVIALGAALWVPQPGVWLDEWRAVSLFVVVIFLVNGWEFHPRGGRVGASFVGAFVYAAVLSLVGGPWIAAGAAAAFRLAPEPAAGLVVMAAVPVTLSSAIVMTEICRGNRLWALFLTIGLNFLGLVSAPVMLKALLSQGAEVGISALRLMLQLVLLVLLPFVLGALARRLLPQGRTPRWLGLIPSLCVALTVYVVFAGAREALLATPLQAIFPAAGAAAVVHGILLGLAALGGMLMRLDSPECRALLFAASQKTLPLAVTVVALVLPGSPAALLPCLLFHFIQLFFDSFLASHLPRHGTTARVPG